MMKIIKANFYVVPGRWSEVARIWRLRIIEAEGESEASGAG